PHNTPAATIELRLEMMCELLIFDGPLIIAAQRYHFQNAQIKVTGVPAVVVATFLLGLIHRHVGLLEQLSGLRDIAVGNRDPNARGQVYVDFLNAIGSGDRGHEPFSHLHDVLLLGEVWQQDDEFISPHARYRIARTYLIAHALRDLNEN